MKRRGKGIFRRLLAMGVLISMVAIAPATYAQVLPWERVVDRFRDPDNIGIFSSVEFLGHLYVGTENWDSATGTSTGGEVWRTVGGAAPITWERVSFGGFGNRNNVGIMSLAVFTGADGTKRLYAGTWNEAGGEVWRSSDGITWTPVMTGGFGNWLNKGIMSLTVFAGADGITRLYAGTYNLGDGVEVWRTGGGGTPTWTRVDGGAFGVDNRAILSMAVFTGVDGITRLYAGTENWRIGGEVWRSPTGDVGTWTQVGSGGFENPRNIKISSMAVFHGHLYAGTENWNSETSISTGGEVWRTVGGTAPITWTPVVGPAPAPIGSGFGNPHNIKISSMAVFGSHLYVGTYNWATGTEVWRTVGVTAHITWTPVTPTDLHVNNTGIFSMVVFGGYLYVGTLNEPPLPAVSTGAEVWRWDGITWTQVGFGGFEVANNRCVIPTVEFLGHLYAGTLNPTGGEVWRSSDGITWTQVCPPTGFGANNRQVKPLTVFGTHLYVGTDNPTTGGEVWRSSDGITWTQVGFGGFGVTANSEITTMAVFGGYLYAGTENDIVGGQVWRSLDGTTWKQVSFGGFGNHNNVGIMSLTVFTGADGTRHLYAGTENPTGGEIWRTAGGAFPIPWTRVCPPTGFGANNRQAKPLVVFGGHLYVGTDNPTTGGEIWRTAGGVIPSWERVDGVVFGAANSEITTMAVLDGHLYVGTGNDITGGEVWSSPTGGSGTWTQVNADGFGDVDNTVVMPWAVFGGRLYAGTFNEMTGGEVWRLAAPRLSVTPASLDFENVIVGQSRDLNFTVTNVGGSPLMGSASVPAGPFTIISGSPFNLGAGTSTSVTVRFSPTAIGPISRMVAFTSNGGNLNKGVSGVGVQPILAVTPASLDFGNVIVGLYRDLSFTVTNTGAGTLTGSASVPAGPFSIVSGSTFTLAAGASTAVIVKFSPIAIGSFSQTVAFTSNGGNLNRGVSGVGVTLTVTPDSLGFGEVIVGQSRDLNFTINNVGGHTITGEASLPAGPFTIVSGSPFALLPGASASVTVRFRPTAIGSFSQTVAFTSDSGNFNRGVSGVGVRPILAVTPDSLGFGEVTIGQSRELSFTVTNTGTGTLNGNASVPLPFTIVSGSPFSLGAGVSTAVTVRFSPTATGTISRNVTFISNVGDLTRGVSGVGVALAVTPSSLDFGNVIIGYSRDLNFTVTNTGTGTLTGSASVPAGPFTIISGSTFTLAAGVSTAVTVRFSPIAIGSISRMVAFTSDSGNLNREVSGVGVTLTVTPDSQDFGNVIIGYSRNLNFTVTNTGAGTLTGSASVPAGPFSIVSGSTFTLAAGASTAVIVKFSPIAIGSFSQTVAFTSTGGNPNRGVSGTGVKTTIVHTPTSFSFLATEGEHSPPAQTLHIQIQNVREGTTINWSVDDGDVAWLTLTPTSGSSTGEIDNVIVAVNTAGLPVGTYTATITIIALGAANTPQTVPVNLTVFSPPPPVEGLGCFIATAAFGTPMAEEVIVLSRFRDEYLLTNELGRRFISLYYRHSPAMAEYISNREWAKRLVRIALLPLVRIAEFIVGGEEKK